MYQLCFWTYFRGGQVIQASLLAACQVASSALVEVLESRSAVVAFRA